METKKISKWDAAPESICKMLSTINGLRHGLTTVEGFRCEEVDELGHIVLFKNIVTGKLADELKEVLDDYNKLEAKHQLDCGLISDYAEENAQLKLKNEKASNNIRELRRVLEEKDIATCIDPITGSWEVSNVALQKKTEHFNAQLDNLRKKLKETDRSKNNWRAHYLDMSEICSRNEDDYEMLQMILEKDGYAIEYDGDIDDETIRCQTEYDICRETTPDEVTYQYGRWTLRRPWNFSEAKANASVAILKKQIRDRDKEIAELKKKINAIYGYRDTDNPCGICKNFDPKE